MNAKEISIDTNRTKNRLLLCNQTSSTPTLFLHGFTGTADSWSEVIGKINACAIAVDIVGHRASTFKDLNSDYNIDDWCDDLSQVIDSLNISKLNLCGYSMGGRLAIAFAARYPQKINQLIIESSSLGIIENKAKKQRFKEDLKLSQLIESDLDEFIQIWENNPLFLNQAERNNMAFLKQRETRASQDPMQLSKSLRVFSQGTMKFYGPEFSKFDFPVSTINGKEDEKYLKIGSRMCQLNKNCSQYILEAGHNVHLENPKSFANTLEKVLNFNL